MTPLAALVAAALSPATVATPPPHDCVHLMSPDMVRRGDSVGAEDLVRLRDIGSALSASAGEQTFSVSPDGRRAALQVHRADAERNGYCIAIVVVELRRGGHATVVDSAEELILFRQAFRGREDYPFGFARTVVPRWSPDGRRVAYLKQAGGVVQVWEAWTDGHGARRLTDLPEGVDDFRYSDAANGLLVASRPDLPARREALRGEALSGHHYDERFAPMARQLPFPPGPAPTRYTTIDLATGRSRDADQAEISSFGRGAIAGISQGTRSATSLRGNVARVEPDPDGLLQRRQHLRAWARNGALTTCSAPACETAIMDHWWSPDGSRVRFLRREGGNGERTAFYEWTPGSTAPRGLGSTSDLLFSCIPTGRRVACLRETSTKPRHLALLDPVRGRTQVVFDPNPEFAALALGRVERIRIVDDFGAPLFADVVHPVGYRRGVRYPVVVVQYESRGFLRGGTGDEYPIQALAGRGFVVLSMNRPAVLAYAPGARTGLEVDRANLRDFTYRRAIHSGVVRAIRLLVERGLADPARVGISGLSDGSSEVQWALVHDGRFAAAAASGCCWGPQTMWLTGLEAADEYARKGYPSWAGAAGEAFWRELSLAPGAARMRTPLLIQAADSELLDAVDAYTALHAAGAPVDLLAFPDEWHVKWQPAHRLAIYRRNVEWFSFWLQGGASHPDLARWRALRDRMPSGEARLAPDWSAPPTRPAQ